MFRSAIGTGHKGTKIGNELPSLITCHSNKLGGCIRSMDGGQISSVGISTLVFIRLILFWSNLIVGFSFYIGIVDMEYVICAVMMDVDEDEETSRRLTCG